MARALTLLSLSSLLSSMAIAASNSTFDYDVLQYVDSLIGSANGGVYMSYAIVFYRSNLLYS
jgi:hypothetical protein